VMGAVKACMKQAFPIESDLDSWYALADLRPGNPARVSLEEKVQDQLYRAALRSGYTGGVQKGLDKFGPDWRDHWGNNALMVMLWGMLDPRPVPRENKAQEMVVCLVFAGVAMQGPKAYNGKVLGAQAVWQEKEDPWLVVQQGKEGFRDNRAVGKLDDKIRTRCREEAQMWERCMLRTQCLQRQRFIGAHLQLPSHLRRAAQMADVHELRKTLTKIEETGMALPKDYPTPSAMEIFASYLRLDSRKEKAERCAACRQILMDHPEGPLARLAEVDSEEEKVLWVASLPNKARNEYLNNMEPDESAALIALAMKQDEEMEDCIFAKAQSEWAEKDAAACEPYEKEASAYGSKYALPSLLGEATKAVQAIFMYGHTECSKVFDKMDEAYPEWILKALKSCAPTTCGAPMVSSWKETACTASKQALAQPMLPLYLCHAGLVTLDDIADQVDAILIDTAEGYPKPTTIFKDNQVDEYLKMALVIKILTDMPEHKDTVLEWVDDYFNGKWVALFKDPDSLSSQNEWFQAAVGPNTMKMRWIREGLTEVKKLKGW